jgi:hypothetical protein
MYLKQTKRLNNKVRIRNVTKKPAWDADADAVLIGFRLTLGQPLVPIIPGNHTPADVETSQKPGSVSAPLRARKERQCEDGLCTVIQQAPSGEGKGLKRTRQGQVYATVYIFNVPG